MLHIRSRLLACLVVGCLAGAAWAVSVEEPNLTPDQIAEFLRTAKVVSSKSVSRGVTGISRLTLSDGKITHDAAFQPVDETKPMMEFATGRREMNFRDSWHFNLAAYELAKLLGLESMIPVHVERKWGGRSGSLSWWVPFKWDEGDRLKGKIQPPDAEAWNQQMYRMRVFSQLVYDTDRNLGNVLITEEWKLWMIDFTRAFRLYNDLENPKNLVKCDRQLLEKLKQLTLEQVEKATKPHLTKSEMKAVVARRDKIVALFEKMAKEKGENEVFY